MSKPVKSEPVVSGREMHINRLVNAPRALVWEVWTNPDHIRFWWGPNGFDNTIEIMEVKPGGHWKFVMHGPDGRDYRNESVFLEVVHPERLVFEHITGPKFRTTVTFQEEGDKTRILMHSIFESDEQLAKAIEVFGAKEGLKQTMNRLESYAEKSLKKAKKLTITRTYNAPVEVVWAALTEPAQMKQWYFDIPGFRAEKGYEFTMLGGKDPNHQYLHLCRVTRVEKGKLLSYSWRYDGFPGDSEVTFELSDLGGKTRLTLTHTGLDSFAFLNPDFAVSNFVQGWTAILGASLKAFLKNRHRV